MDLQRIFTEIDKFQSECFGLEETRTKEEKIQYARECCLALFQEVAELTDSFPFASWKKTETDVDNITREVIDIIFFLHHICRCFGITMTDLEVKYNWVMHNNYMRYGNDSQECKG